MVNKHHHMPVKVNEHHHMYMKVNKPPYDGERSEWYHPLNKRTVLLRLHVAT